MAIGEETYDVIVVGAGPAGCSAAYFAAQEGFKVVLVDKATFPRDKACGDGISPRGLEILERIGVLGAIDSEDPFRVNGVLVSSPNGLVMRSYIPTVDRCRNYGYVFPRRTFDALLVEYVSNQRNITVRMACEVNDLIDEGRGVGGVKARCDGESIMWWSSVMRAVWWIP